MSEEIKEKIEAEVAEAGSENPEKAEQGIGESQEETIPTAETVKKSKLDMAKEKIEKARILTAETREQIEECMKNIDADIEKLDAQKEALFTAALKPAEQLLADIGTEALPALETLPESRVELLDLDADEVEIKEPSSGRFKGFFWALIVGIAMVLGWCYTAANSLGLAMPPEKFPDMDRLNKMLEWTSGKLGQGSNATIGAAVVIVAVLLVMWIVYAVIVSMRASANLKLANETEEAVSLYCSSKEECKEKMKHVREHIQQSSRTLEKYRVLLEEQNAKIKRALFLEEAEDFDGLHAKTKEDIRTSQHLIAEVKRLLDAPISQEGVLTQEAAEALKRASKQINEHIMKIYA